MSVNMKKRFFMVVIAFLSISTKADIEKKELTEDQISGTITSISELLKEKYVFPEVAVEIADRLEEHHDEGRYSSVTDPEEFGKMLAEDLRSISQDKHFNVAFDPKYIGQMHSSAEAANRSQRWDDMVRDQKRNNFGFKEVSLLEGNVGYLDLRGFVDTALAGETAVAAMNFLANTEAIIIDLRKNGGGSPSMIQLISSYFFENPVHLNTFYFRITDTHEQRWTLPHVPGKRMPDVDLYILVSKKTFSAAEEFSYNLQQLERATLVGETTGGGAHPGGFEVATDQYLVWVPHGRAINPITHDNWEGTGVEPHIKVPADQALAVAHSRALARGRMKMGTDLFSTFPVGK